MKFPFSSYYCPYCLPSYQFYKKRSDGVMICGQCGDPLVIKPLIKPTQILAIIAAAAFIAPLIFMAFDAFYKLRRSTPQRISEPMALITGIKRLL